MYVGDASELPGVTVTRSSRNTIILVKSSTAFLIFFLHTHEYSVVVSSKYVSMNQIGRSVGASAFLESIRLNDGVSETRPGKW